MESAVRPGLHFTVTNGAIVLPAICWFLAANQFHGYVAAFAGLLLMTTLLLHEAGHIAVARANGVVVKRVGVCLKGPFIQRERARASIDALISIAGPAVNLLIAVAFWHSNPVLHWVAKLNLVLFITNVLPIKGSDGRNAWQSLMKWRAEKHAALESASAA